MNENKFENLDQLLSSNEDEDIIVELFDFLSDACEYGAKIDILNPHQKAFYLIEIFEMEINNGGFNQYFFNSYGEFVHETIAALTEIKTYKTSKLLQQATNLFPDKVVPKDREQRQKVVLEIEKKANAIWDELDQKIYAYEDDINGSLINYIKLNKASF